MTFRNSNNTTILTSELIAINKAIEYVTEQTTFNNVVIFSDCIEAINSLNTNPQTLTKTYSEITTQIRNKIAINQHLTIQLIWIPSHIGIIGNERIDHHTKIAADNDIIDINQPNDLNELTSKIEQFIINEWQIEYDLKPQAKTYKTYEPLVSTKIKTKLIPRNNQRKLTRLKLGRCNLNFYQFQNGFHKDGLCSHCKVPENIDHHILDCPEHNYIIKLKNTLKQLKLQPTLQNLLGNKQLSSELCTLIKRTI